jgi:predicted PurR-regulated permease PerM
MAGGVLPPAFRALSTVFGVIVDIVLILFFGLYIAAEPELYRWGLLSLVPRARRRRVGQVMAEIRIELKRWLMGQVVAMAVVGVLAAIGLGLSGVAAWPALAIVTGLSEFIPIVGPLTAAVPALLVAFAGGASETLWVAATFLVIHEFESNVLVPLIQRRAASLPPLLSVGALAGAGILLGLPGLVFATPLAVALMVAVRMLYVEDVLGGAAPKPAGMK